MRRLNDKSRVHTISFEMPDSGQYYIALTLHAFIEFVFDWTGNINDYYIQRSLSFNELFVPFTSENLLGTIYEIDKEVDSFVEPESDGIFIPIND